MRGGIVDLSPAMGSWTITSGALIVTITDGPTGGAVSGPSVTFKYTASRAASSFACALDGATPSACPSTGQTYTELKSGAHTFAVTATDAASVTSAPATASFTVDADGPVVTITSPGTFAQAAGNVAFTFTDASPPVTFTCDYGAGAAACTSGSAWSGLAPGSRVPSLKVRFIR